MTTGLTSVPKPALPKRALSDPEVEARHVPSAQTEGLTNMHSHLEPPAENSLKKLNSRNVLPLT